MLTFFCTARNTEVQSRYRELILPLTVLLVPALKTTYLRAQTDLSDVSTLGFIAAGPYIIILSIPVVLVAIPGLCTPVFCAVQKKVNIYK